MKPWAYMEKSISQRELKSISQREFLWTIQFLPSLYIYIYIFVVLKIL